MSAIEFRPRAFREMATVALKFNDGADILIDLSDVPLEARRRIIDFASGLSFGRGAVTYKGDRRYLVSHEQRRLVRYSPNR